MSLDSLTFGLALVGYILLAKDTALRLLGHRWAFVGTINAAVVLAHVALVWAHRFGGSLTRAWEKSPAGFLVFHAALLLIVIAPFTAGTARDRVTFAAFGIVSVGALPAPFRYPEVEVLAIPLLAALAGVAVAFTAGRRRARD